MLEIIYRIYEIVEIDIRSQYSFYSDFNNNNESHNLVKDKVELSMDICICEHREQFKQLIANMYPGIKFANNKNLPLGSMLCVIIGEHAWEETKERYFNKKEYICSVCQSKVLTYVNSEIKCSSLDFSLLEKRNIDYSNKLFCSNRCKSKYVERERQRIKNETDNDGEWITKESFTNPNKVIGYIYKITKRTTGEFYVGQTVYVPIFRWGQHLHTERFDLNNILDYIFEVIELVYEGTIILEREKHWIQKMYKESPKLSLNIVNTSNVDFRKKLI